MEEDRKPAISLHGARDRAVEALGTAFAEDELTVTELEDRVDRCLEAGTLAELEALFDDLPVAPDFSAPAAGEAGHAAGDTARAGVRSTLARLVEEHDLVVAVMGGVGRSGRWVPPRRLHVVALMGGAEIDLREAAFPAGEVTISVLALMGGVEIVVPPDVRVRSRGLPLMGGFEGLDLDPGEGGRDEAVVRIRGVACMGGVEVRVAERREEGWQNG